MEPQIGRRGFITNKDVREPYIILQNDTDGTGGYYLFVHPDSSYSTGFDGWILPEDLGHYFSDLIVEWEDGGENPRVERVLEFCVSEPSDFLSSDGDGFLCCISDLDYWIGLNEGGEYVLADCSPFVSNGASCKSFEICVLILMAITFFRFAESYY